MTKRFGFVLVVGSQVCGLYSDVEAAMRDAQEKFHPGSWTFNPQGTARWTSKTQAESTLYLHKMELVGTTFEVER
jgi:hypothetical protein